MDQGGRVVYEFDADLGKFTRGLGDARKEAASTAKAIDSSFSTLSRNFGRSVGNLGSALAGVGWSAFNAGVNTSIIALTALATKGLSSGTSLQSLQIQMNGLTKSVNLGAEAMGRAYAYAQKAPFQLPEVAGTTKILLAMGLSVKEATDSLELLGNVSITSGVPLEALGSIFGRVSAQGRAMGGDLQQLTENGVAILPALQKQLGKTAEEVRDMASKGQISFSVFRKALESIVDPSILEQLTNTLPRQLDRLQGSVRILSGALVGYTVDISGGFKLMEGSIIASVTSLVKGVADSLRSPQLLEAAASFGRAFSPLIDGLTSFVTASEGGISNLTRVLIGFFDVMTALGPALVPILVLLAVRFAGLFRQVPILGDLLGGIGSAIDNFTRALGSVGRTGAELAIGSIGKAVANLPNALSTATTWLVQFGSRLKNTFETGINYIKRFVDQQRPFFQGMLTEISVTMSLIKGYVANALAPAIATWSGTLSTIVNNFKANMAEIRNIAQTALDAVVGVFEAGLNRARAVVDRVRDIFSPVTNAVRNLISQVAGPLQSFGGFVVQRFNQIKDSIGRVFNNLPITGAIKDAIRDFKNLAGQISGFVGPIGSALGFLGGSIAGRFRDSFGSIIDTIGPKLGALPGIVGNVAGKIGGVLGPAFGIVGGAIGQVGSIVGSVASSLTGPLLSGLFAVGTAAATMGEDFGKTVNDIVNKIVTSGPQMAQNFANNIANLATIIANNAPALANAFATIFTTLANFIITQGPSLIQSFATTIVTLIQSVATPANIALLVQAGITLFMSLISALAQILPVILQGVLTFIIELITQFSNPDVINNLITTVVGMMVKIIDALVIALPQIINGLVQFLTAFIAVITRPDILQQIIQATILLIVTIVTALLQNIDPLLRAGIALIIGLAKALISPQTISALGRAVLTIIKEIVGAFGDVGSILKDVGGKIIDGLVNGIKSKFNSVKNTLGDLTKKIKDWKGLESIDKKLLVPAGNWIMDGFQSSLESNYRSVQKSLQKFTKSLSNNVNLNLAVPNYTNANATPIGEFDTSDAYRYSSQRYGRQQAPIINQTNNVYSDVDMERINRQLAWELNKS